MHPRHLSFSFILALLVPAVNVSAASADSLAADTVPDIRVVGQRPSPEWQYSSDYTPSLPATDAWWKGFGDPLLDSLIAQASAGNYDLRLAARRLEMSRLQMRQAKSAYWPTVAASAGWTKDRTSAYDGTQPTRSSTIDYFSAGLSAQWEIDVFGRIRSQVKSAGYDAKASEADYAAAMLALCAQLAENYVSLRAAQQQLDVARSLSVMEDSVLQIAVIRHDCALASGLDVAQARTVLYSTEASVPSLETTVATTINAIILLLGDSPDTQLWQQRLAVHRPIPSFAGLLASDIPLELVRRRPDVIAQEYNVAALAAQVGIAKKDFLPMLSINAAVGTSAHRPGDLFRHDSFTYSIAPSISWTIFSGLSRKYKLAEARVAALEAVDSYNYTLLSAVQEVDNAVLSYRNSIRRCGLIGRVLGESQRCFDFALDQYRQGLSPFVNLLDAQISLLDNNNSLIAEQLNSQLAVIALYKALGGGWPNP